MPEVLQWLDENSLRSYPLLTNTSKVADSSYIAPNGLLLDLSQQYIASPVVFPSKWQSIAKSGSVVTFTFSDSIVFTVNTSATGIQYLTGTNNSQLVINADLLSDVPTGTSNFTNLYIEPSTIHEDTNSWLGVTAISATPDYYSGGTLSFAPQLPLTSQISQNLTGNVNFFEGYNFGINFDTTNNLINFQVGNSYGIPLSCNDQFIDPTTTDCKDIISFINGVPPDNLGNFTIAPGVNINLVPGTVLTSSKYDGINPDEPSNLHSLYLGLNLLPSDLCNSLAALPPVS